MSVLSWQGPLCGVSRNGVFDIIPPQRPSKHALGEKISRYYIVVTSFFPLLIGSCDMERLVVSCGSLPPLIRRVYDAPWSLSAVLAERYRSTSARRRFCA